MIKRVTVLRHSDDVDRSTAIEHWTTSHADLVNRVPGVIRYVQRPCAEGMPPTSDGALLGIGEVWFENLDAATAATRTAEWAAVIDDAATFVTLPPVAVCWVEE